MTTETISIQVSPEMARTYRNADGDSRRKIDFLIDLWLRDRLDSKESLRDLMNEIGRNARARGLTPEILEAILNER
jgi:hypothetical protein